MASIRRTAGVGIVSGGLLAVLGMTGVQARQEKPASAAITPQKGVLAQCIKFCYNACVEGWTYL